MKKVINEDYVTTCKYCASNFSFDLEDIQKRDLNRWVECPCCGKANHIYDEFFKNWRWP